MHTPTPQFVSPTRMALALAMMSLALPVVAAPAGKLGPEFRINVMTAGRQDAPAVARAANGDFVVVWQGSAVAPSTGTLYARRFAANGAPKDATDILIIADGYEPDIAIEPDGDFVVVFNTGPRPEACSSSLYGTLSARRFLPSGAPKAAEFVVECNDESYISDPAVAVAPDGTAVVAAIFHERSFFTDLVFATRLSAADVMDSVDLASGDNGFSTAPDVAMDPDGDFLVTWGTDLNCGAYGSGCYDPDRQVYAQRFTAAGTVIDPAAIQVNASFTGEPSHPAALLKSDGSFVIAWQRTSGDRDKSFFRRFDPDGEPRDAGDVAVSSKPKATQATPGIAGDSNGGFVVTWEAARNLDGSQTGVYSRRFSVGGAPGGADVRVNTFTQGAQGHPGIAADANGNHVIVWDSAGQDGSGSGVYAQRFRGSSP